MCGGMIKVVAITSNEKDFPLHIELPDDLPIHGKVELDHERTIDSSSPAGACEYRCMVPAEFLNDILQKISLTYKKKSLVVATNDIDKVYISDLNRFSI